MSVCPSVCPVVYRTAKFHQLFVRVVYGCGLVLMWPRCDMLCTSGFVDDVMFKILWFCSVLFCSSAVLDPRVGHTARVLASQAVAIVDR